MGGLCLNAKRQPNEDLAEEHPMMRSAVQRGRGSQAQHVQGRGRKPLQPAEGCKVGQAGFGPHRCGISLHLTLPMIQRYQRVLSGK